MSESFEFAGFKWPRRIPEFYRSPHNTRRLSDGRTVPARMRFAYYAAPRPVAPRGGFSCYLDSDFMPGLRWQWADTVGGARIEHQGWFSDPDGDGDTIRGVVFRLPHGRGFLAGHSMGEDMATSGECRVYACERAAARVADSMAESAAEAEREYQAAWRAGQDAAELDREAREARADILAACADIRAARRSIPADVAAADAIARLCGRLRGIVATALDSMAEARRKRDAIRRDWQGNEVFAESFEEG